jgi:hypothetical protein
VKRVEHATQAGEQPAALAALAQVMDQAPSLAGREFAVEMGRHATRRPTMVAPESQPAAELVHAR